MLCFRQPRSLLVSWSGRLADLAELYGYLHEFNSCIGNSRRKWVSQIHIMNIFINNLTVWNFSTTANNSSSLDLWTYRPLLLYAPHSDIIGKVVTIYAEFLSLQRSSTSMVYLPLIVTYDNLALGTGTGLCVFRYDDTYGHRWTFKVDLVKCVFYMPA